MRTTIGSVFALLVLICFTLLIPASQAERSIVKAPAFGASVTSNSVTSSLAPPVIATEGTSCTTFDFSNDDSGFTVVNVQGAAPLWHRSTSCRANLAGHSTPVDFYYGREPVDVMDPGCNYNTGARNASNLVSPTFNLTAPTTLSFNYLLFVEGGGFDSTFVDVSTDGGVTWTQVLSKANLINDNQWHNVSVDLSAAVGAKTSFKFRFRFDSVDNIANSTTGWHVDDLQICGTPAPTVTLNAVEGQPFSNQTVAKFLNPSLPPDNFTATINWGDGSASSPGVITPSVGSVSSVLGSHTYLEEGSFNITVVIHDNAANTDLTITTPATVADAPLIVGPTTPGASTTFSGIGGNNASVAAGTANAAFSAFKAAIGGPDNGGAPPPQASGFRTINWDAVALNGSDFGGNTTVISLNNTVGIPVNRFQARGALFDRVHAVSNDGFATVNPGVAGQFPAFSPSNTFASFNNNVININFVLPSAPNTPAIQGVTRGFGAVFLDVETLNSTSIEYFSGTTSLGKFFVPLGASGQAEFFGVLFQNPVVTSAQITLGQATLFSFNGVTVTPGAADSPVIDQVATDDFAYPEPAPVSTGININATAGAPFTAKVASFKDADPNGQVSDYSVVIDWGDGTSSTGGITPNSANPEGGQPDTIEASITPSVNGGFDVTGTHTYASVGTFTITTSIRDIGGASISASSVATVTTQPSISIGNVTVPEGNSGTTNAPFTVSLSSASSQTVTVDYVTSDGSASASSDYDAQTATLTFPPGVTTRTINVAVKGETVPEPNETFFVTLANPVNATIAVATGTGTINDDDAANIFQFSSASASVNENAVPGSVTVTVTRTGDTSGVATVNFETTDGTAKQKSDYAFGYGTVQFGPGETSKAVPILITNDALVEGPENFQVALSNAPSNSAIGFPGTIDVTINDDDAVAGPNPIDDTTFFVRQHYLDFLGREADSSGLAFWSGQINSCGANAACIGSKRVDVSASFFLSIEFQETGGYALRIQRAAFGRLSEDPSSRYPYLSFMRDTRTMGQGVVVGQPGFDALLEQNKQAYAQAIVNSSNFALRFPPAPASVYVDALFASAGVTPTSAERTAATNAFGAGGNIGRVAALRSVADSASLRTAESRVSFVLAEYYGYLRRNPTDAPDFNNSGYQFWLNKLNQFNGNYIDAEMVKAFITSIEYRQRFGP